MKINLTQKIIITLSALIVSSASLSATDYTSQIIGNFTFQNGDTVILEESSFPYPLIEASGISAGSGSGAIISVANPATDGIYISIGTSANPIVGSDFFARGLRPVIAGSYTSINLGTNTTIETFSDSVSMMVYGVIAYANADFSAGDNLTIRSNGTHKNGGYGILSQGSTTSIGNNLKIYTAGGTADAAIYSYAAGNVTVGDNAYIETYGLAITTRSAGSVTVGDYLKTVNANVGVASYETGSRITVGNNAHIEAAHMGVLAQVDSFAVIGDNLKVYATNQGINATSNGNITVGDNAYVESAIGVRAQTGASITMQNSTIKGIGSEGVGLSIGPDATINVANSTVNGEQNAIYVQMAAGGPNDGNAVLTVSGGTLTSQTGAVIASSGTNDTQSEIIKTTVVIKDGTEASSLTGIFYEGNSETSIGSELEVNVMGVDTIVDGRFLDGTNLDATFSISDGATWNSVGASNMDNLVLEDANINMVLTSASDRIVTDNLTVEGSNIVNVGLTNDFLEEIIAMGLPQDFDVSIVASFTDGTGSVAYDIATSNDEGSTWSIDDLGNGVYRIYDITLVPEPSTYAMIFGALALGFAAYRRRK